MSVATMIQRLLVPLHGDETEFLIQDATRFLHCDVQSANDRSLQHLTLPYQKSLDWMRKDSESALAELLAVALVNLTHQYASQPSLAKPSLDDLCSSVSPGLQDDSILRVCWEECGGSMLSPFQAKEQWAKINKSRLEVWSKVEITGKSLCSNTKIETSAEDPLLLVQCTLRLFAEAIIKQPSIVLQGPDAFREIVTKASPDTLPLVPVVKQDVQVSASARQSSYWNSCMPAASCGAACVCYQDKLRMCFPLLGICAVGTPCSSVSQFCHERKLCKGGMLAQRRQALY